MTKFYQTQWLFPSAVLSYSILLWVCILFWLGSVDMAAENCIRDQNWFPFRVTICMLFLYSDKEGEQGTKTRRDFTESDIII